MKRFIRWLFRRKRRETAEEFFVRILGPPTKKKVSATGKLTALQWDGDNK